MFLASHVGPLSLCALYESLGLHESLNSCYSFPHLYHCPFHCLRGEWGQLGRGWAEGTGTVNEASLGQSILRQHRVSIGHRGV